MPNGIESSLAATLSGKQFPELILRKIDARWPDDEAPARASADFYYLGLRDSLPMLDELCAHLRKTLVDFCLPRLEILDAKNKYAENGDETIFYDLLTKARRLFIKARTQTKRSGEGGELILYCFLELIKAPQIVSKMSLKTSSQMPIHGSDGLHIGLGKEAEDLIFYYGESKLHSDFENSPSDALSSSIELANNYAQMQREIELITDHLPATGMTEDQTIAIKDYLNPYSEKNIKRKDAHACLIGFDFISYKEIESLKHKEAELEIEKKAKEFAEEKLKNLKIRLKKEKYKKTNFIFFFLPVPSVEDFRVAFNNIVLEIANDQ